jgi:hypothetical protein
MGLLYLSAYGFSQRAKIKERDNAVDKIEIVKIYTMVL